MFTGWTIMGLHVFRARHKGVNCNFPLYFLELINFIFFCSSESPLLWMRADPEMEYLAEIHFNQPIQMWVRMKACTIFVSILPCFLALYSFLLSFKPARSWFLVWLSTNALEKAKWGVTQDGIEEEHSKTENPTSKI